MLALPNLVSLTIWHGRLQVADKEQIQLPMLEILTFFGIWENFSLISAPRLTRLALKEATARQEHYISALLDAISRPTSLILNHGISGEYLVRLFSGPWSNLRELHIVSSAYSVYPDPVATKALAGGESHLPLCPCLRVLTITVNVHGKGDRAAISLMVEPFVDNLKIIVDGRKRREIEKLQRATCLWNFSPLTTTLTVDTQQSKQTEWVDFT